MRGAVLAQLADLIVGVRRPHPTRVALDGVDAAGKTTLADELAPLVEARGRASVRASLDGFHRPRAERHRRGRDSADGYYRDAFDLAALRRELLEPLGPGGSRRYRTATFDLAADVPLETAQRLAPDDAVLLVDGVFLQRPELDEHWDLRVFVHVELGEALRRGVERDGTATRELYERRYLAAQRRYLAAVSPRERADAVVVNDDPASPRLVRSQTA